MSAQGTAPMAQKSKKPKKRVDNTGATGEKKIYRTKAYTYLEKDNHLIRVPGAAPINDLSVIHGPPPPNKLAELNKKAPKPKKIALSTATVLILTVMIAIFCRSSSAYEVTSNNCYKASSGKDCYWLSPEWSAPQRCATCPKTDGKQHLIIGTNGLSAKWSNLVYVNATTGKPNTGSSIGRLAPAVEGTLLWELVDIVNTVTKEGSMNKIRHHEARISSIAQEMSNMRHDQGEKFDKHIESMENKTGNMRGLIKQNEENIAALKQEYTRSMSDVQVKLNNSFEKIFRLDEFVVEQSRITHELTSENERLKNVVNNLTAKLDKVEEEMAQLIMDAVHSLMQQRNLRDDNEVHVDYGVAALSTPPLFRSKIKEENGLDVETTADDADEKDFMLKIRYGFVDVELRQEIVKNCSCTNGVMKLCNIEIKFNSTKAYKPDESTYCLLNVTTSNGIMSRKERLSCKQSDVKDACTLSLVVGQAVDMSNVTLVRIGNGYLFLDDKKMLFKNKLIKDLCEYSDESRPYNLRPTSKYRPIFVMCNITDDTSTPTRATNRLHYMVVVCAVVLTTIIETVYQSWVMGVEILLAAVIGMLVVLEDALVSASMQLRNYALLVVLVGCFSATTTSRLISSAIWILMLGWLYTVEAIDGMTFTVNGIKATNKITYETSLNMHASDTLIMGNVSLTLKKIRQRREYDYVYTMPTVITMKAICRTWDCTNTAPNCVNKCDGACGELAYSRCSAMQMYHSCVWSPLQCAACEGTGALFEKLCFDGNEACNLFDSPSNQGDREIVLEYNIDGRTETHIVKVGQDAYSSGGIFRITSLEILSTSTIGTVAKCSQFTWCRKQKLPTKDFCGWYGMESNSSQMDPECLRIKNTRAYADGASIQSKVEYRTSNFNPSQYGFRLCNDDEVETDDEKAAVVWTLSPGARLNIYHEQELDATTTQLCDDIESLSVSVVSQGQKHAFKTSTITITGQVEQECLIFLYKMYISGIIFYV